MIFLTTLASLLVGFFVSQQCYGLAAFVFANTVLAIMVGILNKSNRA